MRIKILILVLIISLSLMVTGCSADMSGIVIDAETGKPIEGAVVLVEWTIEKGLPGLGHTESYKVVEVITDKEGKFKVSGVFNPLVDPPDVTVYKKGYIAWNNKYIFPDYRKREDFIWRNNILIKIGYFNESKYSYSDHIMFIHGSINYGLPGSEKKLMEEAIRWEQLKAIEKQMKTK